LTVGEAHFFAREEMATTAADVARRRSRLFLEGKATPEALGEIARALSELLHASEAARSASAEAPPEDVEHATV
jgi:glycerol-3-phosphate dehydrogenase